MTDDEQCSLANPAQDKINAKNFVQRLGNKVAAFANMIFAPAYVPSYAVA